MLKTRGKQNPGRGGLKFGIDFQRCTIIKNKEKKTGEDHIKEKENFLSENFEIKDFSEASRLLGIATTRKKKGKMTVEEKQAKPIHIKEQERNEHAKNIKMIWLVWKNSWLLRKKSFPAKCNIPQATARKDLEQIRDSKVMNLKNSDHNDNDQ